MLAGRLPRACGAGGAARPAAAAARPRRAAAVVAAKPKAGEGGEAPKKSYSEMLEAAFLGIFAGEAAAPRVLASFRRLESGASFEAEWPGQGRQSASSYVEGLTAVAFPDVHGGAYPWLQAVEASAATIIEEFERVALGDAARVAAKGSNVWVPAARDEAVAYGPDWRTLVLQDRGAWDLSLIHI